MKDIFPGALQENSGSRISGVWAAITTPFNKYHKIDFEIFRENLHRLANSGVHGIYTTDSDGEFYALELDEFRTLVNVFAEESERFGFKSHVGVTWCNTEGIISRLRHCLALGIQGAHVGHPFFMPMTTGSNEVFWKELSAIVPESFELVHYNTRRCQPYLSGVDYKKISKICPALRGTKTTTADVTEFGNLIHHAPQLQHLALDGTFGFFAPYGATGICSWFVNINPKLVLNWYKDAQNSNWSKVFATQKRILAFQNLAEEMLENSGDLHGIVAKVMCTATNFLVPNIITRRPYLPIIEYQASLWREKAHEQFADLLTL